MAAAVGSSPARHTLILTKPFTSCPAYRAPPSPHPLFFTSPGCSRNYTLRDGDTCAGIATQFGYTLVQLIASNADLNCGSPVVGSRLCLNVIMQGESAVGLLAAGASLIYYISGVVVCSCAPPQPAVQMLYPQQIAIFHDLFYYYHLDWPWGHGLYY